MDPNFVYPAIFKNQTGIPYFPNSGALGLFASGGKFYLLTNDGYVSGLIDSSQTGNFGGGGGSTGYLTGYVSKSETGVFYPASNPSGFITGVDLSAYVTGSVVRPSETGNFITSSQTGQFYPTSNPSGFITGVDLSNYVTGDVVRPSETGSFVTNSQTGQFVSTSSTGAFLTTGAADERYVNVTGDTVSGDLTITGRVSGNFYNVNTGGYIYFPGQPSVSNPTHQEGKVFYDTDAHTLCYYNEQADVTVNIGQEQLVRVSNGETGTILNGSVVFASGALGNRPKAFLASAQNVESDRHDVIGIATHDIVNQGYVTVNGLVNGLNTTGFTEGDTVYLSLTPGEFTNIPAPPPSHPVKLGIVTRSHQTQGQLYVNIDQGDHLSYLHDVNITELQDRDILRYNNASGYWENQPENTGAFLTTGAADARYYGLTNGQSISGYAITGFNDAITGITVTGDTTKTITLFQRDNTTLTASFTDNAGSGSSDTGYLTGYVSKTETGNIAVGTIGLVLDGGGSTITTGYKSFTTAAFSGEILSYTVLADRTGSIVIDVWKDTYANYPLTSGNSICATNKVTLATGIKNTDSTLTSWIKTFSVGDNFGFNVDSVSGVQKISLTLRVKKA